MRSRTLTCPSQPVIPTPLHDAHPGDSLHVTPNTYLSNVNT
ncbi:hypothetical protein [Caudoviricetes sp.]|nr:hypothetical protein [Caudoviricetes sp.]